MIRLSGIFRECCWPSWAGRLFLVSSAQLKHVEYSLEGGSSRPPARGRRRLTGGELLQIPIELGRRPTAHFFVLKRPERSRTVWVCESCNNFALGTRHFECNTYTFLHFYLTSGGHQFEVVFGVTDVLCNLNFLILQLLLLHFIHYY